MGLDVYIKVPGVEAPPSKINPEHLFKLDYWRSSYNAGGFNTVVGHIAGADLYTIAGITRNDADNWVEDEDHEDGGYSIPPKIDWEATKVRALDVAGTLREAEAYGAEFFSASSLRPDMASVRSDEDALKLFHQIRGEHARVESPFGKNFSNWAGTFLLDDPLEVAAFIPGNGFMGKGVYVIFKHDPENINFYAQAAEIVAETAQFVLDNGGEAHTSWSG